MSESQAVGATGHPKAQQISAGNLCWMWEFVDWVVNFFGWRSEAEPNERRGFWYWIFLLSFWVPAAAILLWLLYLSIRLVGDWIYRVAVLG